jgi:hypothetical protein
MRETKLYARLRPQLVKWGEVDRVENSAGVGMPDVYYNIEGVQGWLETKVAKGPVVYFERFQLPWMRRHVKQGNHRIFVVVLIEPDQIMVCRASQVVQAPRASYNKWVTVAVEDLEPEFVLTRPYKWSKLRQTLIS